MEFGRDVVLDPLVDGLGCWVCFDLLQQLLLQFHEREQEAQTLPLQNLQHTVLVLVYFCTQRIAQSVTVTGKKKIFFTGAKQKKNACVNAWESLR